MFECRIISVARTMHMCTYAWFLCATIDITLPNYLENKLVIQRLVLFE